MQYEKLQEKAKKWIGCKAANTTVNHMFGIPGLIEKVQVQPTNEEGTMFKLFFLINYGSHKLLSSEEDTVIYLKNRKQGVC